MDGTHHLTVGMPLEPGLRKLVLSWKVDDPRLAKYIRDKAALAGLRAVMSEGNPLGLGGRSTVVLLSTEGATDPEGYERVVGRPPESIGRP